MKGSEFDIGDVEVATVVEVEMSRSRLFRIEEVNEIGVVNTVTGVVVTCGDETPFCWVTITEATVLKVCETTDVESTLLVWTTAAEVDDTVANAV